MNRSEFFISAGVIFYLFVSLNYPILDVLVNPVKAANPTVESHYNLKSPDLFLDTTIKTHKWKVCLVTDAPSNCSTPKPFEKVILPSPISSKPPIKISTKPLADSKPSVTIHVVKPGDTLWKISAKYGVRGSTICKLNNLREGDILKVGMKLQMCRL